MASANASGARLPMTSAPELVTPLPGLQPIFQPLIPEPADKARSKCVFNRLPKTNGVQFHTRGS